MDKGLGTVALMERGGASVVGLTLALETLGGVMTPLFSRNTAVPTSKSEIFTTGLDGQTQVEIHVIQGERALAKDNLSLGWLILDGIPPAARGVPQIEVTFDIGAKGSLTVSAQDKATGRRLNTVFRPTPGLRRDDVERLVKEAEARAQDDRSQSGEIELSNKADSFVYKAKWLLLEHRDLIPDFLRSQVEGKIAGVRSAMQSPGAPALSSALQGLEQSLQEVGQYIRPVQATDAEARTHELVRTLREWEREGYLISKEVETMADGKSIETLVKSLDGRIGRLRGVQQEFEKLDTAEFQAEAQPLRALIKDPSKVEEAERLLGELKEAIAREGRRRKARRLLEEGVSLGRQGASQLEQGKHVDAQGPLKQSLERLGQAVDALGDGDPRLLESIATDQRATATNLLFARLGAELAVAQQGVEEFERQAFDQAEATFQRVRDALDSVAKDARSQAVKEPEEEAARRIQEVDQNIESCRAGKDARRVEELVQQGNARWDEAEQAVRSKDLLKAREILAEAVKGIEDAFTIASRRSFQDVLPNINQLRQRVQARREEVYNALAAGVQVAARSPMGVRKVTPKGPSVAVQGFSPEPTALAQPGKSWDQTYERVGAQPLGQGGYADVYLARRKTDGVQVALKVPRGMLAGGATLSDRVLREFQLEADNWRALRHDHIVELYDYGQEPYPWLSMELMAGGSLKSRLGQWPASKALDVFLKVCGALEFAHKGGIVHRDIKPENILFNAQDIPKVSDWGLARHALFQSFSQHGYSGTLAYSAPEQIEPEHYGPYEHPGDVFQLGIVLFETLTGRHPFVLPDEDIQVLSPFIIPKRIVDGAFQVAAASALRPDLPEALDGILLQALRRPLKERYREVWMLREALEPVLRGL